MKSYREENRKKLTTQDVIDIAVELYDNKGRSRGDIYFLLKQLKDSDAADFDIDRVFDLVVG